MFWNTTTLFSLLPLLVGADHSTTSYLVVVYWFKGMPFGSWWLVFTDSSLIHHVAACCDWPLQVLFPTEPWIEVSSNQVWSVATSLHKYLNQPSTIEVISSSLLVLVVFIINHYCWYIFTRRVMWGGRQLDFNSWQSVCDRLGKLPQRSKTAVGFGGTERSRTNNTLAKLSF